MESNGEDVSTIKEGMANVMGSLKGVTMGMAHDSVIKNAIADFATEHFEIATYQSLIETAKIVGDEDSIPVFESILEEEKMTAQKIEKGMPKLIQDFLEINHNS